MYAEGRVKKGKSTGRVTHCVWTKGGRADGTAVAFWEATLNVVKPVVDM